MGLYVGGGRMPTISKVLLVAGAYVALLLLLTVALRNIG
jgi:hypothetical protein